MDIGSTAQRVNILRKTPPALSPCISHFSDAKYYIEKNLRTEVPIGGPVPVEEDLPYQIDGRFIDDNNL